MARNRKPITPAGAARAAPVRPPTYVLRPDPPGVPVTPQALHDLARQLGLEGNDRIAVSIVGDELQLTLTPLGLADGMLAAHASDGGVWVPDAGPSSFPDDMHTRCADGGRPIRHRPHVPASPTKVCLACASRATADGDGSDR